jgi:heat shock protein HtpX
MRRLGLRLLMAAVGVSLSLFYLLAAAGVYLVLAEVWSSRPDWPTALAIVVAITLGVGYLSYRAGTAQVLSGLDAAVIPRERAPGVHRRLDRLVDAMEVERPQLLIARMRAPNALALGGRSPVVVIDRSLFRLLDGDELETIVAHELAHLESRDGLVQTLAYAALRTVAGVVMLALLPVLVLVTGLARAWAWIGGRPGAWTETPLGRVRTRVEVAVVVVMAVLTLGVLAHSRRREFAADDRAAAVTGKPVALARALRKLERASEPAWGLLSPLYTHSDDEPLGGLFSTHPDTDERVERLLERAERSGERTGGRRIPVQ